MEFPAIEDHGLIGDLPTSALVCTDGTVDWLLPAALRLADVLRSLINAAAAATLAPVGEVCTRQMYLPGTAILVTRFLSEQGVGRGRRLHAIEEPGTATDRHRLIRMITASAGR